MKCNVLKIENKVDKSIIKHCERIQKTMTIIAISYPLILSMLLKYGLTNFLDTEMNIDREHSKQENYRNNSMPVFNEIKCPTNIGFVCLKVTFPSNATKVLVTKPIPGTSIFEGFVFEDNHTKTVIVGTPKTSKVLILLRIDDFPACYRFNVDLLDNSTRCINSAMIDHYNIPEHSLRDQIKNPSSFSIPNTVKPIVRLSNHYGVSGIPFNVMFAFDVRFQEEFRNKDGKTMDEHMETIIALVKWAFLDKSLSKQLGTTVNIIGTKKRLMETLPLNLTTDHLRKLYNPHKIVGNKRRNLLIPERRLKHKVYHATAIVTTSDVKFVNFPKDHGMRLDHIGFCDTRHLAISATRAFQVSDCNEKASLKESDCSSTILASLTSWIITHQIGHNLGMNNNYYYDHNGALIYRKYENESENCTGWMDRPIDSHGWSKCSVSDLSRYFTANGTKEPCLTIRPSIKYITKIQMEFTGLNFITFLRTQLYIREAMEKVMTVPLERIWYQYEATNADKNISDTLIVDILVATDNKTDATRIEQMSSTVAQNVNIEMEKDPRLQNRTIKILRIVGEVLTEENKENYCTSNADCPPLMICELFRRCVPENMKTSGNRATNTLSSRVMPGDNTTILKVPHSQPWMVGLMGERSLHSHIYDYDMVCGATLISPQHVLTAAHCILEGIAEVVVGEHDLRLDDGQSFVAAKKVLIFRKDSKIYINGKNDVAIILLEKQVVNPYAIPVKLPRPYETFKQYIVSGWGSSPTLRYGSEVLRTASLNAVEKGNPLFNTCPCPRRLGSYDPKDLGTYGKDLLCGENLKPSKSGPCKGDSGSPWVAKSERGFVIAGIHIWGVCRNTSAAHTSVKLSNPVTLRWIRETIRMNYVPPCSISDQKFTNMYTLKEVLTLCSNDCIDSNRTCKPCITKNSGINLISSSCKGCLEELNTCVTQNCAGECLKKTQDPYECEKCTRLSDCSSSKCFSVNYIPI